MAKQFDPSYASASLTYDKLFAGEFPRVTETVTLASGQNLQRGAVLGKITASGKYKLSASGAGDGSETPEAILADDVDASGGDKRAPVYLTGEFNEAALTFGSGHTASSTKAGLRAKSIFLKAVKAA